MLTKKGYLNLVNKFFYKGILDLHKKLKVVCFINLSFRLDSKYLVHYQIYLYFFLSLYFGHVAKIINLMKDYHRLSLEKGYPLGVRIHLNRTRFYTFTYYFSKWYYYNIFGELKSFILDKKKGNFFGLKIPFINLFYLFDYNLITFFLYNLNIPQFKMFISVKGDKHEVRVLKNLFGFH